MHRTLLPDHQRVCVAFTQAARVPPFPASRIQILITLATLTVVPNIYMWKMPGKVLPSPSPTYSSDLKCYVEFEGIQPKFFLYRLCLPQKSLLQWRDRYSIYEEKAC